MTASQTQASVQVPLLDLKAQYASIENEIKAVMDEVCREQRFILGPKVNELETQIAAYSQAEFGIGVSSGTDALLLALMALEIGAGDAVITTPYSFFATAGAIARLGARPLFCDIESETYNLDPNKLRDFLETQCERRNQGIFEKQSGAQIKALMPVHLYGQTASMQALLELAAEYELKVIEDAAQAIGSEYYGKRAGSMGDIGCFSFFPSKNLGAFGDGGMCTTNDPALAERMRILRVHGSHPKYYHAYIGGNFRLDELQAAVLIVKLHYLDSWTKARQKNAEFYNRAFTAQGLSSYLRTPSAIPGCRHIYNQYVIRVAPEIRDSLRAHLQQSHIGTEIYYPVPLHMQACFAYLGYAPEDYPESAKAAASTIALPIYPELTNLQLQYVVDQLQKFLLAENRVDLTKR